MNCIYIYNKVFIETLPSKKLILSKKFDERINQMNVFFLKDLDQISIYILLKPSNTSLEKKKIVGLFSKDYYEQISQ